MTENLPNLNSIKGGGKRTNIRHTIVRKKIHTEISKNKITREQISYHERQNVIKYIYMIYGE